MSHSSTSHFRTTQGTSIARKSFPRRSFKIASASSCGGWSPMISRWKESRSAHRARSTTFQVVVVSKPASSSIRSRLISVSTSVSQMRMRERCCFIASSLPADLHSCALAAAESSRGVTDTRDRDKLPCRTLGRVIATKLDHLFRVSSPSAVKRAFETKSRTAFRRASMRRRGHKSTPSNDSTARLLVK